MSDAFSTPYPGYDVLAKRDTPSFDPITRAVIDARVGAVPPRRFFDAARYATLEAACDRIVPQPDRKVPIPIAPWIDAKLHEDRRDGTRFAEMPPQREAWREGLTALDAEARWRGGAPFSGLSAADQDDVLRAFEAGDLGSNAWPAEKATRFFGTLLLREVVGVYYAHPDAWSEMGFGGPASPRGYARLEAGRRDPWEAEVRRRDGDDG